MAKRSRKSGKKKLKAVPYRFIRPESDLGEPMYALLRQLVVAHHSELVGARIALAWNLNWKADIDGHIRLGQCLKVSDLHREVNELQPYDFVIVLRQVFWTDVCVTDLQRRALLDHELCHATVALDDHHEPIEDERGRTVYRIRRHNLEEFSEIAERYGCWKGDIEHFARALHRAHQKTDACWIGFTSIQEQLQHAGANVDLEVIVSWTDAQRREAMRWAILTRELRALAEANDSGKPMRTSPKKPDFLANPVVQPEPVQDVLPPIPPADFPLSERETATNQ